MPIKKSAFKHLRQTKKRTQKNIGVKKNLKEFVKKVRKTIVAKDKEKLQGISSELQKVLDKAAKKCVIKKNTAARKKSRLMRQINLVLKA
jgi:small subunit ribosomal protein S20